MYTRSYYVELRRKEWSRSRILLAVADMACQYGIEIRADHTEVSGETTTLRITCVTEEDDGRGGLDLELISGWRNLPGVIICQSL